MNIDQLNVAIADIVSDYQAELEAVEAVDYSTRCSALEPGSALPAKGGILVNDNIRHIENYGYSGELKAKILCDAAREEVAATMADAPSDEALRAIQSLSLRGDSATPDELGAIAGKYGGSYQVREYLQGVSDKLGYGMQISRREDEMLRRIDLAEDLCCENLRLSAYSRKGGLSPKARLATLKQQLANGRRGL